MENQTYEKNITILKKIYGEKQIDKLLLGNSEKVMIEKSKNGNYALKISIQDKEKYINSKYDPLKEAKRFVDHIKEYDYETIFIVYGIGAGYHILELDKKLEENNRILVIEPNADVFNEVLKIHDWTHLLESNKVDFFVGTDIELLSQFYDKHINMFNVSNFKFLIFSQYDKIYPEFHEQVIKRFKECVGELQVYMSTAMYFSYEFNKNLFKNIKHIIRGSKIQSFKNEFKNIPAIIVSAGPSLDKNIKKLKDAQGKAVIIAGGRTLKPLLDNNIIPDIVVSIDPGQSAYEIIKETLNSKIPLITTPISQSDIIHEYKGEKVFINVEECTELIKDLIGEEIERLPQGGSVANMCLSVADYMDCNPLILIGQDLAFTNNKCHAENSTHESDGNNNVLENGIEIEDIHGRKVFTNKPLLSFLRWFEAYIQQIPEKEVIDATEGGAKIKGTNIMTLEETIQKYCGKEIEIGKKLNTIIEKDKLYNEKINVCLKRLKELKKDLSKVKKSVVSGKDLSEKMLKYYEGNKNININNILKKLDKIDGNIKKYEKQNMVIYHLISPTLIQIYNKKEFQEKINETEEQRGIRLSKKGYILYKGIQESIDEVFLLINDCIKEIEQSIKEDIRNE